MVNRLMLLPKRIEELKIEILEKTKEYEDIKEEIKKWEMREMLEITNEVDEKGKLIHSNETKRQAELMARKAESEIYKELANAEAQISYDINMAQIKLDKLYNEQGNLRAIARLEGRE